VPFQDAIKLPPAVNRHSRLVAVRIFQNKAPW